MDRDYEDNENECAVGVRLSVLVFFPKIIAEYRNQRRGISIYWGGGGGLV